MSNENIETVRYKFAFIVDQDVAMAVTLNPSPLQMQHAECLRNNPEIIEVEPDNGNIAKFNFVNDGVVNYVIDFPNSFMSQRGVACLRSNPTILEVESSNPVKSGWKYNGTDFYLDN